MPIAVAAIALAACAPSPPPAVVSAGPAQAEAPGASHVETWARLLEAADSRRPDSTVILAAIRSGWSPLRAAGALAAGQLRVRELRRTVRDLLTDPDTSVAASAAFALGLLRDTAAIPVLDVALKRGGSVGADAAWALGEIGVPAAGAIERGLAESRDAATVGALLLASAKLPTPAAQRIRRHLGAADSDIAWQAAYAFARNMIPAGARALAEHSTHRDPRVRAQVARGLARRATGDSLARLAIPRLSVLVSDPHPHVRINAIRAFATHGDSSLNALFAATRDGDANVRIAAAQSLGGVLGRDLARWAWLWQSDTSLAYQRSILASAIRSEVALPAARAWSDDPDWRLRHAAAAAVSAAPSAVRVVQLARVHVSDPDVRVRQEAFAALATVTDSSTVSPLVRPLLLEALRDPDPIVRAVALAGLGRSARSSEVEAVLDSYSMAASDSLEDARLAAVRFLGAAWRLDSASMRPATRSAISDLPVPEDPLERAVAAGNPLLAHWRTAPATRDWREYADYVRELVLPSLEGRNPRVSLRTERGSVELELFGADAPMTVANFLGLARSGYYDGLRFHRVVPNFVVQDGDQRGDGSGGPGYAIRDELNRHRYIRGVLGMALSGPNTGGSQYFITHSPQPHLDGYYTIFGRVAGGYDALDAIVQGDRVIEVRVPAA